MRSQIESVSAYCDHFTRVDPLRSTIVDFSFASENLMDATALNTHIYSPVVSPAADRHHGSTFLSLPAFGTPACRARKSFGNERRRGGTVTV